MTDDKEKEVVPEQYNKMEQFKPGKANTETTDRKKGLGLFQLFALCKASPFVHVALTAHTRSVNFNSLHYKLPLTSTGHLSPQMYSGNKDCNSEFWSSDDSNNVCIKFRSGVILCGIGTQY